MNIKHLDHLNLTVRSLDETISWYGNVFGFAVVERGRSSGVPFVILRAGDAMLCVYESTHESAMAQNGHAMNHFALRIDDAAAWMATISRLGIPLDYGGGAIDYPHSTSWYVRDPTGYQIEVVAWNHDTVAFG